MRCWAPDRSACPALPPFLLEEPPFPARTLGPNSAGTWPFLLPPLPKCGKMTQALLPLLLAPVMCSQLSPEFGLHKCSELSQESYDEDSPSLRAAEPRRWKPFSPMWAATFSWVISVPEVIFHPRSALSFEIIPIFLLTNSSWILSWHPNISRTFQSLNE